MRQEWVEIAHGIATLRLAYTEWGSPASDKVVVCVHGLTRNAHDFDFLAGALAGSARVLGFDVAGRGDSDRLADAGDYNNLVYAVQLRLAMGRLGLTRVDWVGTSMGGLIGMLLAAMPQSPIRRLVLNDIGPFVPKAALAHIQSYVGLAPTFPTMADVEGYLRTVHAPFGPLSDAQWRHLASHSVRSDGVALRLRYDPRIRGPFANWTATDLDLWTLYDAIRCPTLVLRGQESQLLTAATAAAMRERGPRAELVTFAGVGHAPALMSDDQIAAVVEWLRSDRP